MHDPYKDHSYETLHPEPKLTSISSTYRSLNPFFHLAILLQARSYFALHRRNIPMKLYVSMTPVNTRLVLNQEKGEAVNPHEANQPLALCDRHGGSSEPLVVPKGQSSEEKTTGRSSFHSIWYNFFWSRSQQ